MKRSTGIEWTEHTWNPFVGCTILSAGCTNCYAMRMAARLAEFGTAKHYIGLTKKVNGHAVWTGKVARASDSGMRKPYTIRGSALIFVNSMSDFFHENAADAWRLEALAIMRETPQHQYQVLTKRPEQIAPFLERTGETIPDNFWLGASVEDYRVVKRIDALRAIPARIRFLSVEPIINTLGPMDLTGIHQVITGGESGPGARACKPEWVREVRDQCIAQNVPHFFKQWGHWRNNPLQEQAPKGTSPGEHVKTVDPNGKGGALLDGRLWREYPAY